MVLKKLKIKKEKKKIEGAHDEAPAHVAPRYWQCDPERPGAPVWTAQDHFNYWNEFWDRVLAEEAEAAKGDK